MLFKKSEMPEQKYMPYRVDDCTGTRTNRNIKDGLGGSMEIRSETVKRYKKSKKKEERAERS